MRVTTIGTGTGAPSATRVMSSLLIEAGAVRALFDCGSGALFRMANLGIDWKGITHLCVSHFHPDHISDIPSLLYAWRYGSIPWRSEPVDLIGPPGFNDFFDRLDAAFGGGMKELGYELRLVEMDHGGTLDLTDDVTLTSFHVPHTVESVAYSVGCGGRRVVYTGDTAQSPALGKWAQGCDLLIAECSLPTEMAVPTHLTPELCAELAATAAPAALALTHLYPPVEQVDIAGIVGARYA